MVGALLVAVTLAAAAESPARLGALARSTTDRADDRPGAQLHVLYVLPNDGADASLDTDGTLGASVSNFQNWLKGQTGGNGMRLDTYQGELDVSFLRLADSDAQLASRGLYLRDAIEAGVRAAGFDDSDKRYVAYYGGSNTAACGGGAWPPTLPGTLAAIYMKATYGAGLPCYDPAASRAGLQLMDLAMLHETLHTLGFVATCALNHTRAGHVSDSPNDLMYAGDQPWVPTVLDINRDDYFGANRPGCADLSQSEYYEGGPDPQPLPVVPKRARLTVGVQGRGRVLGRGIACPKRCSAIFAVNTRVVLRPIPAKNARFRGWSGACRGTSGCRVQMSRARSVRATFVRR